jgi:uncharacterized protein
MTATLSIEQRLAHELNARQAQVDAAVRLLDDGATVPFIARYRKEATGGLDDAQLRTLEERLRYLRELDDRRASVLASIGEQGKLTDELRRAILAADTKTRLEDLYLPFKKKRRTKAAIARERGLEPLADALLGDPTLDPRAAAARFVDPAREVPDADGALDGARHILVERFAEDAELVGELRKLVRARAELRAELADESKRAEGQKFRDWFDHHEPLARAPSHRVLALLRGRNEGVLSLRLRLSPGDDNLATDGDGTCVGKVLARTGIRHAGRPADDWLVDTARAAWRSKLAGQLETELIAELRERAETEAIVVFAQNLHDLLLAAPAGHKCILGLDPGLRTGVKVAVVDGTGKLLETATIFPTPPRNEVEPSLAVLQRLVERHGVDLVSIGNGTGSRETDRLAAELVRRCTDRKLHKLVVSEAGASVYSASELASRELPDLDVSLRGAVSIARRVQDPLAELVKIEPRSIGVGQYQHDVNQAQLARSLDAVVEDCVNRVGVDANTASPALLARVAGLGPVLARNLVEHRDAHGAFRRRKDLLAVPRLGPKAFEQAAGFLRIQDGDDPLDASAVHPEAYPVVERICKTTGRDVRSLVGDAAFLRGLDPACFTDERFGVPTVTDILRELEKPGRDPRPEFVTAGFKEGVEKLEDLAPGMQLEGVVTNVAAFGAFVDIGVHQDGLVHVSQLADSFVEDPRDVVRTGQVVEVRVVEVDLERKRIALTMRRGPVEPGSGRGGRRTEPAAQKRAEPEPQNPFARAFGKLRPERG